MAPARKYTIPFGGAHGRQPRFVVLAANLVAAGQGRIEKPPVGWVSDLIAGRQRAGNVAVNVLRKPH